MNALKKTPSLLNALLCLGLAASSGLSPRQARAQAQPDATNAAPVAATAVTNAPPTAAATNSVAAPDEVQLSFQGANVDMIVQWLAKATGKTVVKHPRVQCQLTIVGSKNLSTREAINVVYRALALEGFTTVESSKSIMIVPEGQDVKMNAEVVDGSAPIPEGRQKLVKVFALRNVQAADMKDKLRGALSEKGTMEIVERSNQLMVTDLTDNLRLMSDLIKELDVPSAGDSVIQFYPLKNSDAEEVGNLITLVLNAQPSSGGKPAGQPSGGPMMPPGMPASPPSPSGGGSAAPQVRIWPDKSSNRLIVAAPKSRLTEVQNLIDLLDTDKPKDVTIRVISLKHVSAEDLVREVAPLYQKLGNKGGKESVEVTANARSNSLIVFSNEANFKAIEKLVANLDTDEAQEKIMQTFPLKNAEADDVAKQIQDLYKDQGNQNRYPFFFFSSSDSGAKDNKKVNVVADRRRNSIIVQAPPSAMDSLAKLVATLDEPVKDSNLTPRIYKLKYVNAADIEDVLNELFKKKKPQRSYFDYYDSFGSGEDSSDNKGASKLYGKIQITSEPYSNAIIITSNSAENLEAVEDVLKQLDAPSEAGESTFRVGLKFAKAMNVATSLNILFAKSGSPPLRAAPQNPQPNDGRQQQPQAQPSQNNFGLEQEAKEDSYFPWLGGQQDGGGRGSDGRTTARPVSDLVGKVRVVPDRRINSILISCNIHFLPQVMKLIGDLDAPTAQVLIEAKIVEVSSDFRDKLGVRWSPDGSKAYDANDLDNAVQLKSGATYNQVFAGPGGEALKSALHSGVLNTSVNLDFLVQFLRKNTDSKVLAEPQINIADNELGKLFVGSQVPFISGSLNTDVGGRNDTFQYRDVGIILEVTPHINESEEVALRIRAESSSIRSGETLFGGAILDTRNFRTDVMVKSGQTVVLGGIIQREEVNTMRKTPLLGSIPGLGWAFKKKDKSSREVELMVFLRPWVTRTPEEAQKLLNRIDQKTPLIKQWENQPEEEKSKARKEVEKSQKKP